MKMVPLGEVIRPAKVVHAGDSNYPLLSMTMHDGLVEQARKFKKRVASSDISKYKVVRHGQLVVGFPIDEGVVDFQMVHPAAIVSPAYGIWDLIAGEQADRNYLHKYLRSPQALAYYRGKLRGSTARRRSLPQEVFLKLAVPLPPLPEQRRIAAILDKADAIRAKRRQVLAHLDSLPQAIFQELFGTIPPSLPMFELAEGFRYGTSNKSGKSGYPALRIPNVVGGTIETSVVKTVDVESAELARLELRDGDVLFVRTNGNPDNVGRSAAFSYAAVEAAGFGDQPWIFASYLIRARFAASTVPTFVTTYLATPAGRRQLRERSKTSVGQYNINIESLSSVRIPSVSVTRQREFAAHVALARKNCAGVERALAADDALFASLQSRAFRGEL